jgi:uncharacterized protein YlxW (UPF0749 family)
MWDGGVHEVKGDGVRWLVGILIAAIFGLVAVVWTSVNSELIHIHEDQHSMLRDINDLQVSVQDLKTRVMSLSQLLDTRETQRIDRDGRNQRSPAR